MTKRIIYEKITSFLEAGGVTVERVTGVCIMTPVLNDDIGLTIEEIALKDVPVGQSFKIIEDDALPTDRTFRDAWEKNGASVGVDMQKARGIHMGRIRRARKLALDKTDIEVTKELEQGPVTKELKDKRQTLRDLPATFDLSIATNPEELKALWPQNLPR